MQRRDFAEKNFTLSLVFSLPYFFHKLKIYIFDLLYIAVKKKTFTKTDKFVIPLLFTQWTQSHLLQTIALMFNHSSKIDKSYKIHYKKKIPQIIDCPYIK